MEIAIWDTPEHVGHQIIHAHCEANGMPRRFTRKKAVPHKESNFNISFRKENVQPIEEIEDLGTLAI
jgi:hypothetical protein